MTLAGSGNLKGLQEGAGGGGGAGGGEPVDAGSGGDVRGLLAGVWRRLRATGGGGYSHAGAVRRPVDARSGHVWEVVVVVVTVPHGPEFTHG